MSELVRFHKWILDKECIACVYIEENIGCNKYKCNVIVEMKKEIGGKRFTLQCRDELDAKSELDLLTINAQIKCLTKYEWDNIVYKKIGRVESSLTELHTKINKIEKSLRRPKNKEI